jgi:hypothetical protein
MAILNIEEFLNRWKKGRGMLSKIINILNTCILKSGAMWAELLPGDFLDTLERPEKINFRTLRQQLKQKALTQQALTV